MGHIVYWLNYEDPNDDVVLGRASALGLSDDLLEERFRLWTPPERSARDGISRLLPRIEREHPSLIVLDSSGEAMGIDGVDENKDREVQDWYEMWKPVVRAGPALSVIDHGTKDERNELFPSGSKRKRAAVSGMNWYMKVMDEFSRERSGHVHLVCAKDRHGTYTRRQPIWNMVVEPDEDGSLSISMNLIDEADREEAREATRSRRTESKARKVADIVAEHYEAAGEGMTKTANGLRMGGNKKEREAAWAQAEQAGLIEFNEKGRAFPPGILHP